MPELNYFQTYSQQENHVTNNTLLMLRHVYRTSPRLMEQLLSAVLEDDKIKVGLSFSQQKRTATQIPDGVLSQDPLHIYIEAKHGGTLDDEQIIRHLDAIAKQEHPEDSATLIGLTTHSAREADLKKWSDAAKTLNVRFRVITYNDLIAGLRAVCASNVELTDILDDYEVFIDKQGLRPDQHRQMVAFLCGTTYADNVKTNIYYEPEERPAKWQRAHFMGIYHGKRVGHVGRIKWVVAGRRAAGGGVELRGKAEFGTLPVDATDQILTAITLAEEHYPNTGQDWLRFYATDAFVPTDFQKRSPGGMMGHRYFDLEQFLVDQTVKVDAPIQAIAEGLKDKSFK